MRKNLERLPEDGYIREAQLIASFLPVSRATLWRMLRDGRFPAPVKITSRISAWRVEDVRRWMEKGGRDAA
jgi:predicted DNA-binding transcriptional regulator AlpA